MTDREKLLDLFHEHNAKYAIFCDACFQDTPEELDSKTYRLVDHLLANGIHLEEKQATSNNNMRWYSVSDCLPKQKDVVLVRWTNGICSYYGSATYQHHDVWYVHNEGMPKVTHWMRLPEPPEEQNKSL